MKSSDYKKLKITNSAITRNPNDFDVETGNIYKTVAILSKRANQISANLKDEFMEKAQDFRSPSDSLEETFDNHEQIEWSKYFEQLPIAPLLAIKEFEDHLIYFREPKK